MFGLNVGSGHDSKLVIEALSRSLGIIEFDLRGTVLTANENFCKVLGYDLAEIKGQHHSKFIEPAYAQSVEYREFWAKLGRGEFDAQEYKRIGKGGREVWIQASYNPVKSSNGTVLKVVKVATDITAEKLKNTEFEGKLNAISRVQAVIEFLPSGEIVTANENFLGAVGYRLDEIKGRHHRIFVESAYGQSHEYQDFWAKLNRGEFVAAEFMRIAKGGKQVWLQASYNPIFDMSGKVVKFATDVTERVRAVSEIAAGLSELANNNLDVQLKTPFSQEFEKLRADFNLSLEKIRSSMSEISESTTVMQSGTHEISTAADDLARRTEQQAASLEETAAALGAITETVKKSAAGASHAREIVATADQDAKKSAGVVRQAVEAMDGIAESARKITQIIGVIDEIAFQTNLLALNAGVEAARAGDAGRGFAVVASEVRALAQRSAEAAKEIKGLISASSAQVDQGVKLVDETGKSLERIMTQVGEINTVVAEIAAGAKEQAQGIEEVNTAITQMDQMTQQNAAMVEESTAASHHLSQEATQLAGLVGQFKAGGDPMRRALKDAAPHAFRGKAPAPAGKKPARAPQPAQRTSRAAAGGNAGEGWDEF